MTGQAQLAITESDVVLFLVDGRAGLTPQDQRIAQNLRESGKKTYLVVNKAEGLTETAKAEFYELAWASLTPSPPPTAKGSKP